MKWLRSLAGVGAGLGNLYANGMGGKQILMSLLMTALGVITHATSTDPQ